MPSNPNETAEGGVPKVDDFSEIISERLSDHRQWSGFLLRRLAAAWF